MKCFRCGFTGHVLADCEVPLCDYCEKLDHESEVCPLLAAAKPQVLVHGLASDALMFYEMILTETYRPKNQNTRLAMITVTGGELSIPEIARRPVGGASNGTERLQGAISI